MDADEAKTRLQRMRDELEDAAAANADARDVVELDQTSVGRLSRMDAIERQAMAQATERRRQVQLRMIDAALKRIDEGEWGYCVVCGEGIPAERLNLNPTAPHCVGCGR